MINKFFRDCAVYLTLALTASALSPTSATAQTAARAIMKPETQSPGQDQKERFVRQASKEAALAAVIEQKAKEAANKFQYVYGAKPVLGEDLANAGSKSDCSGFVAWLVIGVMEEMNKTHGGNLYNITAMKKRLGVSSEEQAKALYGMGGIDEKALRNGIIPLGSIGAVIPHKTPAHAQGREIGISHAFLLAGQVIANNKLDFGHAKILEIINKGVTITPARGWVAKRSKSARLVFFNPFACSNDEEFNAFLRKGGMQAFLCKPAPEGKAPGKPHSKLKNERFKSKEVCAYAERPRAFARNNMGTKGPFCRKYG